MVLWPVSASCKSPIRSNPKFLRACLRLLLLLASILLHVALRLASLTLHPFLPVARLLLLDMPTGPLPFYLLLFGLADSCKFDGYIYIETAKGDRVEFNGVPLRRLRSLFVRLAKSELMATQPCLPGV